MYGYVFEKLKAPGYDLCESIGKKSKSPLPYIELGKYCNHYKAKGNKALYKQKF